LSANTLTAEKLKTGMKEIKKQHIPTREFGDEQRTTVNKKENKESKLKRQ
jgi:hypothetical protein